MRDYSKLDAFKLADDVVLLIYQVTKTFPKEELYGLTAQIRRAAISVPSNIVEGCARESQQEYIRFLGIAYASLREAGYQLSLAKRLGYLSEEDFLKCHLKIVEAEKVLYSLKRSLHKLSSSI
ncbi:MAG: four helix bundle protein [Chthoniobacterales bacterium]|nr:four helix bundle protein [Chthoniobacterales bacterium]